VGEVMVKEYPFDDAVNVRDLGGYVSDDGRQVIFGQIIRGVTLDFIRTPHDQSLFDSLHLKTIIDLRSEGEVAECPEPHFDGVDYFRICASYYDDGTEIDFSPEGMMRLEAMIDAYLRKQGEEGNHTKGAEIFYKNVPFSNPAFIKMFEILEQGDTPLLFHCTAGKDRTGIAAILILLSLGVSREQAIHDYMLTNVCRQSLIEAELKKREDEWKDDPERREQLIGMMGVRQAMADFTLDLILDRYGDFDTYFEKEFHLDHSRRTRLKNMYLK